MSNQIGKRLSQFGIRDGIRMVLSGLLESPGRRDNSSRRFLRCGRRGRRGHDSKAKNQVGYNIRPRAGLNFLKQGGF